MSAFITRRGGSGGGGELAYCDVKNDLSYNVSELTFPGLIGKNAFTIIRRGGVQKPTSQVITVELTPEGTARILYVTSSGYIYYESMGASTAATNNFFDPTTGKVNLNGFGTDNSYKFNYGGSTYRAYYAE